MTLRSTLVVGNDAEVQQLARQVTEKLFVADDPAEALDLVGTAKPDLVVFHDTFEPTHVKEFLDKTDKSPADLPVVVVGGGESTAAPPHEFLSIGVRDYIQGRGNYNRLKELASQIDTNRTDDADQGNAHRFFIDDLAASIRMAGLSKAIRGTLEMIKLVAESQCNPVLILGETGTGKELVARAIHKLRHPDQPFVAVNCAALTATLLESELFGHVKGSFTGADRDKTGLLELADKGTIFLDEISEMPLGLQSKLLRVLQEKTFRKVGGLNDITTNATMIASSNRNLKAEVQTNRFRQDLYYRLCICPITIAPLRSPQRREDIPLLAEYFLRTSNISLKKRCRITTITNLALEALQKHNWPGNVRELSNVIDRAVLLETTDKIGLSSIVIEPAEWQQSPHPAAVTQIGDFSLEKAERELIARALQQTGWQKTQAAALLGITRATLYAKVKQYNIKRQSHPLAMAQQNQPPSSTPQPVATA